MTRQDEPGQDRTRLNKAKNQDIHYVQLFYNVHIKWTP